MQTLTLRRLAWLTFGFVALCFAGALALSVLHTRGPNPTGWSEIAGVDALLIAMFSFPVVGVLVASRQPHNAIGWILLAIGLVWELAGVAGNYVQYGFVTDPGSLPRPDVVAALTSSVWVPGIGLIGTFLILLFPDGRLPSPRWKPLAWLCGLVLTLLFVLLPLTPGTLADTDVPSSARRLANPLGVEALGPLIRASLALLPLVPLCVIGCALSLIGRYRRSHGQERLQLKWLAAGAGAAAAAFGASFLVPFLFQIGRGAGSTPTWITVLDGISLGAFVLIPVAAGIAILKHRLYDIDVLVNRTLVYGALTAVLVLVYAGSVVVMGGALRSLTGSQDNNLAVAASTLAVAALFRPARARIQGFIDRRFYRRKYDATKTLEDFSARLRDEVDLDASTTDLLTVIRETMQPEHASLWLKQPQ